MIFLISLFLSALTARGYRHIGFARPRRADGKQHVVLKISLHQLALVLRTRGNGLARSGIDNGVAILARVAIAVARDFDDFLLTQLVEARTMTLQGGKGLFKFSHVLFGAHDFEHVVAPNDAEFRSECAEEAQVGIAGAEKGGRIGFFKQEMLFYHRLVREGCAASRRSGAPHGK